MAKVVGKTTTLKDITKYSVYLVIVWAFYRFLFKFPENIEEIFIKPVVWLVPVYFLLKKEKLSLSSIGVTHKNLFQSLYFSLFLGALFVLNALLTNYLKYKTFNFSANIGGEGFYVPFLLSFATAFTEEISFRGFIYNRLSFILKDPFVANIIQALVWTAIHVPIVFVVFKLGIMAGAVYLLVTFIFGFGSALIFGRTKNIFGSIFLHVLWQWPIILFR